MQGSANAIEPNSPEGEEIELLSLLIEKYEHENYQSEPPSPIEAIRFRMEQMNLKQADIAPLLGGKTRVSEVLNGKRALTGYFGDTDPRFGDIDPLNRLRLKEHDRLTILPFFS